MFFCFAGTRRRCFTTRLFATSTLHRATSRRLRSWIYDVSLGAGTDPRRASRCAHQMHPDAVFLLSDGQFNQPQTPLSESGWIDDRGERLEGDVQAGVEMIYRDIPVHTVAFENPFTVSAMQQIAEASGGHVSLHSNTVAQADRLAAVSHFAA